MRPTLYKNCGKLPFDLYCPSAKIDDPNYCCAYCKKICTTKELLKLHLRATQHHACETEDDEDEELFIDIDTLPVIEDGACLIPCMDKFLECTWDVTYA